LYDEITGEIIKMQEEAQCGYGKDSVAYCPLAIGDIYG
jgi:hypothetical protein